MIVNFDLKRRVFSKDFYIYEPTDPKILGRLLFAREILPEKAPRRLIGVFEEAPSGLTPDTV